MYGSNVAAINPLITAYLADSAGEAG